MDVLHVVVLFQGFHQPDHLSGLLSFELNVILWNHRHARGRRCDPSLLHRFQYSLVHRGFGEDFPVLAIIAKIVRAGVENDAHQIVFFGRCFRDHNVALLVKHPGDGSGLSHVTAILTEHMPDFAYGAVAIVSIDVE